jgi:hypothetical protein
MTPSKTKALTYSTEGDEVAVLENKLFLIAKKVIEVKAVIEKTESAKRVTVLTKIVTAIKHVCPLSPTLFSFSFFPFPRCAFS